MKILCKPYANQKKQQHKHENKPAKQRNKYKKQWKTRQNNVKKKQNHGKTAHVSAFI
jgi:hypothetical protein